MILGMRVFMPLMTVLFVMRVTVCFSHSYIVIQICDLRVATYVFLCVFKR